MKGLSYKNTDVRRLRKKDLLPVSRCQAKAGSQSLRIDFGVPEAKEALFPSASRLAFNMITEPRLRG